MVVDLVFASRTQSPCIPFWLSQQATNRRVVARPDFRHFCPRMLSGVDWLSTCLTVHGSFVTTPQIALANPLAGLDHGVALWFHAHLTPAFVSILRDITEFGSSEWIAIVLSVAVLVFIFKRWWPSLVTLVLAVPGGMLLNELVKILVHRHRPFEDGPFVDWSGYSFASGHTIGATLLYGQLLLFALPLLQSQRARRAVISSVIALVVL